LDYRLLMGLCREMDIVILIEGVHNGLIRIRRLLDWLRTRDLLVLANLF
jgi:hypothetical protein